MYLVALLSMKTRIYVQSKTTHAANASSKARGGSIDTPHKKAAGRISGVGVRDPEVAKL